MEARIHEFFIPPVGFIRNIPLEKQEEYRAKYSALGPFIKHEYDLDVCTLYRQLEDLKGRYDAIGGLPYVEYVALIKTNAEIVLREANLDTEFYLKNFYYVINPDNTYYFSFLGLFFALSDPLKIIPILEHHLEQFPNYSKKKEGAEYFLGKLEYFVCNYLRTNRFPEDYFVKHDKIINWIYSKREIGLYRTEMNSKLEVLISSINRLSPKQKILKEIIKNKPGRKRNLNPEVFVVQKMVDALIQDLSGYFSQNNLASLRQILIGKAEPSLVVLFDGNANQLIDAFRIYTEAKFIEADKRSVAAWICQHFMYKIETKKSNGFIPFDNLAVERVIYSSNPLDKSKRIPLTGLPKARHKYYSNKKKSRSHTHSDV